MNGIREEPTNPPCSRRANAIEESPPATMNQGTQTSEPGDDNPVIICPPHNFSPGSRDESLWTIVSRYLPGYYDQYYTDVNKNPPAHAHNAFTHESFLKDNGAVIHFVNRQIKGIPRSIGAIRIPPRDPLDIAGYITENIGQLKLIGIDMLMSHIYKCNHPAGLGEQLIPADYAFTFSVISLSKNGLAVAGNEMELGLWALSYPMLLEPIRTDFLDSASGRPIGEGGQIYINAHIRLNDPRDRRTTIRDQEQDTSVDKNHQPMEYTRPSQIGRGQTRGRRGRGTRQVGQRYPREMDTPNPSQELSKPSGSTQPANDNTTQDLAKIIREEILRAIGNRGATLV